MFNLKSEKMIKYIKDKKSFSLIILTISLIIFISIILILINNIYIHKKRVNSNFVLKNTYIAPINTNVDLENFAKGQYKDCNEWRVLIPKINVNAPIFEGTEQEILRKGVGHFRGSSTFEGNVCLAAHNRGYRYNYFQEIKTLNIGDEIIYKNDNYTKKYKVVSNVVIEETDWSYFHESKENKITLITCEENKREYRRCIQAIEI